MTPGKRISVLGVAMLGLGLLTWSLWPGPAFMPSVRLPEGVSLAEALRDGIREPPKGWHTNLYSREGRRTPRNRMRVAAEEIRYEIHAALGRSLRVAPNRPVVDFVTPRLGECFYTSGEKYLLAKELAWEVGTPPPHGSDWTFLGFVWGGTNQLVHARDRITLIEDGILKHGVFGMRLKWSLPGQSGVRTTEYFRTNRCVVIRDTRGLVKIVPLDYLKAYAEAGLVTVSNRE